LGSIPAATADLVPHRLQSRKNNVTTMLMLFRRKAVIPLWLVVFGLFAMFGSSMTFAAGAFVLLLGTLALTMMLILWKAPPPTIAEVLHQVEEPS
jgi:hypothetical protein